MRSGVMAGGEAEDSEARLKDELCERLFSVETCDAETGNDLANVYACTMEGL